MTISPFIIPPFSAGLSADASPYDLENNIRVAAHLFYTSGKHHWNPSKKCWGE